MQEDFALHITWTYYGTWLPGDDRGYVSNTLQLSGDYLPRQNRPNTPYTRSDPLTSERSKELQKWPTVYLNREQALLVAKSIVEGASQRRWYIAEAAIMAAHTHVVIMNCPADGSSVRRVLKGVAQAKLSAANGVPRRWFTQGGSDRYKNDARSIENAIQYVARHEGKLAGVRAMQVFEGE